MASTRHPSHAIQSVVAVGGGTAGYFAALAVKQAHPAIDVTVIESSKIPIIGVGEATTTLMPPFLHRQLGIDIVDLYRAVRPTWKLGITFEWGLPGDYAFAYPFGASAVLDAVAHDGHLGNQSTAGLMMAADRAPLIRDADGALVSLLPHMKFAYHLDNQPFVAFLQTVALRAGIHHIDAQIEQVETTPGGTQVECLRLDDGRTVRADLYIDASGFRALLIEQALGSPFESYASSLFCDGAVVGDVPQSGPIRPYTTAETMAAGWCWRIPVEGEDHRGYVFSSAHLTPEAARAEMQARNPGLGDTWTVRFRSGRHREFWKGNAVAVGNAYGFVEPLQSTALHMVIVELAYLLGGLAAPEPDRDFANRSVAAHWDFLRWFLALHYKFNRRCDTEFWRDCHARVDVSGLQALLDRFTASGPWSEREAKRYEPGDPAFSFDGLMIMLLGQQVSCPPPAAPNLSRDAWAARVAEGRELVARALPQAEALALLRQRPELLQEAVASPDSWINRGGELLGAVGPGGSAVHPQVSAAPRRAAGRFDHLFEIPPRA